MEIRLPAAKLRSVHIQDAIPLARHANNRKIWLNVRDHFPHPYTSLDSREWIEQIKKMNPETHFVIDIDDQACGAIGLELKDDIYHCSAELGYWLGEEFWDRGIMTSAVQAICSWAFQNLRIHRIQAEVFEWNPASMRVLEKSGFMHEGILHKAAVKNHQIIDLHIFARLKESGEVQNHE